jgi:hypothetical protein
MAFVSNTTRILNIISALRMLWMKIPDMRFIQLVYFVSGKIKEYEGITDTPEDLFYIEDDKLEGYIFQMISEVSLAAINTDE